MKMVAFPGRIHSQKAQLFANIRNFLFGGADNVDADLSARRIAVERMRWISEKLSLLILCCLRALAVLRCSYVVFRVSHGCRCLGRHHFCPKIHTARSAAQRLRCLCACLRALHANVSFAPTCLRPIREHKYLAVQVLRKLATSHSGHDKEHAHHEEDANIYG